MISLHLSQFPIHAWNTTLLSASNILMLLEKIHRAIIWFISSPFKTNQICLLLKDASSCQCLLSSSLGYTTVVPMVLSGVVRQGYLWCYTRLTASWRCWTYRCSDQMSRRTDSPSDKWQHVKLFTEGIQQQSNFLSRFGKSGRSFVVVLLIENKVVQLFRQWRSGANVVCQLLKPHNLCNAHDKTGNTDMTSLDDGKNAEWNNRSVPLHSLHILSHSSLWAPPSSASKLPFNIVSVLLISHQPEKAT